MTLARNILSNWTSFALGVAYTLYITPILLNRLQSELYGTWHFLNGLTAYSQLLHLGLGAALIRNVARMRAENDSAGISRVASVVMTLYGGMGLLCLTVFAGVSPWIPSLLKDSLTDQMRTETSLTWLLLGAQYSCLFVGSAFAGTIVGFNRFDLVNVVRCLFIVVRAVVVLSLVTGESLLLRLATGLAVVSLLETAAFYAIVRFVLPGVRLRPIKPTFSELRQLYSFGFQAFLILLSSTLIMYTDTVVIGSMVGVAAVTYYAMPQQILEYARMGLNGVTSAFLPKLSVLFQQGRMDELRRVFVAKARLFGVLSAFVYANILFQTQPFLSIWVGDEIAVAATLVIPLLAASNWINSLAVRTCYPFLQAMDMLRVPARILIVEAVLNLVLSVALAPVLGIVGVAIGTLIPAALVSGPFVPLLILRRFGIAQWRTVVGLVLPGLIVLGGLCALLPLLAAWIGTSSYLHLVVITTATLPPAALAAWLVLDRAERARIRSGIAARFAKLRGGRGEDGGGDDSQAPPSSTEHATVDRDQQEESISQ